MSGFVLDEDITDAMWRVKFAASRTLPKLSRVFVTDGWVWACDAYRLAAVEVDVPENFEPVAYPADALPLDSTVRPADYCADAPRYGSVLLPGRRLGITLDTEELLGRVRVAATPTEHLPRGVVTLTGWTQYLRVNAVYVIEALRECGPAVSVRFPPPGEWSLVLDSDDMRHVIMPIRPQRSCDECVPGYVGVTP